MALGTKDHQPTVLITGATGLLGRQVFSVFSNAGWRTVGTGFSRAKPPSIHKLDLTDPSAVEKILEEESPNAVVHCTLPPSHIYRISHSFTHTLLPPTGAAERFPDKVAQNPDAARALNTNATQHLASLCKSRSILLLYLSTDYVFPGRRGEAPYHPSSTPDPPNLYGRTKLDGERAVLETTSGTGLGVVLRVPVLYGAVDEAVGNKESAVNVLLDSIWAAQEEGKEIKIDDWSVRYPTNTEDVARVMCDVVKKWTGIGEQERKGLPQVLQFSANEAMTKYRICEVLAEIMGLETKGLVRDQPVEGDGGGAGASRPYDTKLDSQVLRDLGIEDRYMGFEAWWRWQVKAYRK
ncbi:MAG: hypothetical protein Q9191_004633 [Dirinaria sp. TL-2023a]